MNYQAGKRLTDTACRVPTPIQSTVFISIRSVKTAIPPYAVIGGWLAGIPDDARVIGGTLVVKGGVGELVEIIDRSPAEQEFSFGVIEPSGVMRQGEFGSRVTTGSSKIFAEFTIINRFIHADIEGLLTGSRMVDSGKN